MITQTASKMPVFALVITLLAWVSGCSTTTGNRPSASKVAVPATATASIGDKAAAVALRQVGVPYLYGGSTTRGFDCSGLVQFSYDQAGKALPRTTGQQWSQTRTIQADDLRPGDLLFFSIEGKMSHVGLYVGEQQFVHAPSTGRTVTVASLNSPFYSKALLRAGRPK